MTCELPTISKEGIQEILQWLVRDEGSSSNELKVPTKGDELAIKNIQPRRSRIRRRVGIVDGGLTICERILA